MKILDPEKAYTLSFTQTKNQEYVTNNGSFGLCGTQPSSEAIHVKFKNMYNVDGAYQIEFTQGGSQQVVTDNTTFGLCGTPAGAFPSPNGLTFFISLTAPVVSNGEFTCHILATTPDRNITVGVTNNSSFGLCLTPISPTSLVTFTATPV